MDYKNIIDKIGIEFEGLYTNVFIEKLNDLQADGLLEIGHDGTVHNDREDTKPYEVETAPLDGNQLDRIIRLFTQAQDGHDYYTNQSTGLHYHISLKNNGFGHLCRSQFYDDMILLFRNKYPKIWNERKNNNFCWADYHTNRSHEEYNTINEHFHRSSSNRYHLVNYSVESSRLGEIETVEIRFYGGTYSTVKELKQVIKDTIVIIEKHVNSSYELPRETIQGELNNAPSVNVFIPDIRTNQVKRRYFNFKKQTTKGNYKFIFNKSERYEDINEVIKKVRYEPLEVVVQQRGNQQINI